VIEHEVVGQGGFGLVRPQSQFFSLLTLSQSGQKSDHSPQPISVE
jgi:hypothetical protein